jgi:hypothetical protein
VRFELLDPVDAVSFKSFKRLGKIKSPPAPLFQRGEISKRANPASVNPSPFDKRGKDGRFFLDDVNLS